MRIKAGSPSREVDTRVEQCAELTLAADGPEEAEMLAKLLDGVLSDLGSGGYREIHTREQATPDGGRKLNYIVASVVLDHQFHLSVLKEGRREPETK
jgi:hypothetical protein